jgi:two-component system, LytTR family, sensor kinase
MFSNLPKNLYQWLNLNPFWIKVSVAITLVIGLLNFSAFYSFNKSYGLGIDVPSRLFDELTGTFVVLIPLPFLLLFYRRFPITRQNLGRMLLLYLGAMLLFGVIHTMLMTLIRQPLYPILGFGDYRPGNMFYRTLMEMAKVSPAFWFIYFGNLVYLRTQEAQKKQLRLIEIEGDLAKAKLASLQAQLNPHFLFNSLNLISSMMYEDISRADKLLSDLSELLRYSLDFDNVPEIPLHEEINITQKYVAIMIGRFGDRLTVQFDIDPLSNNISIPIFTLQPLVENAVKFTMGKPKTIGKIEIQSRYDQSVLTIRVVDNGPGLANEKQPSTQTGIHNIRARLHTLYGDDASLVIQNNSDSGAEAVITIKVKNPR